ncbi:MAG: hypothetical protein JWP78_1502 [Mucilaginibacter sp.]|nr:hypothetical protein [Mucilaginibacter sp.]
MKYRLTAILLIISIICSSFSRFFIYAGFEMNQSYIASKLCENRNKPWLHCNGKCYLMKKVRQAEEKQNASERETQKNLVQEAYCHADNQVKFYTHLIRVIAIALNRIELPERYSAIFRPPQLG